MLRTGSRVRLPEGVAFRDRVAYGIVIRRESPPNDVPLLVVLIDGERFPARVPAASVEAV